VTNLRIDACEYNIPILQPNNRTNQFLVATGMRRHLLHLNLIHLPVIHHTIALCKLLQQQPVLQVALKFRGHPLHPQRVDLARKPAPQGLNSILKRLHRVGNDESLVQIEHNRQTPEVQHPQTRVVKSYRNREAPEAGELLPFARHRNEVNLLIVHHHYRRLKRTVFVRNTKIAENKSFIYSFRAFNLLILTFIS